MKIGNLREEKPRRTELPNGLRIITERLRHVRSVSTGIWTATGARWEAPGETGIAHFLEHMLFKGTLNRSVAEIARTMDALGGNLDAYTSKELVSYNVKVLAPHLPTAMDVLSDMVRNPLLAEEDIEKEKGVILEELKMEQDNPESFANDLFQELFWPDHTLGTPILGTPETVAEFSPTIVRRYFQDYYVPANMVVTAAGNIEHDAFVELVASRVKPESWSNGSAEFPSPEPQPNAGMLQEHNSSVEQAHLYMGVPSFPIASPRRFALYLLNVILGGCSSSRLFQRVREDMGAAYTIYSDVTAYQDAGCFSIYCGTAPRTIRPVVKAIMEEVRDMRNRPVPEDELTMAKDHVIGSMLLSTESPGSRMTNLARQEIFFGRFFTARDLVRLIGKVTAEEIREMAQELFNPDRWTVTLYGNLGRTRIRPEELA